MTVQHIDEQSSRTHRQQVPQYFLQQERPKLGMPQCHLYVAARGSVVHVLRCHPATGNIRVRPQAMLEVETTAEDISRSEVSGEQAGLSCKDTAPLEALGAKRTGTGESKRRVQKAGACSESAVMGAYGSNLLLLTRVKGVF